MKAISLRANVPGYHTSAYENALYSDADNTKPAFCTKRARPKHFPVSLVLLFMPPERLSSRLLHFWASFPLPPDAA